MTDSSASNPDQNQGTLPLSADPAWGALVGTFLLAMCLGGPIGLALALAVLILMVVLRRRKRRGPSSSSHHEQIDDEFAARFRELEDDILQNDHPWAYG